MDGSKSAAEINLYNEATGNLLDVVPEAPRERFEIAAVREGNRSLEVTWADGHVSEFHYIWLRHHCYCSSCGDCKDGVRFILIPDIPCDIGPSSVTVSADNNLKIVWANDQHRFQFTRVIAQPNDCFKDGLLAVATLVTSSILILCAYKSVFGGTLKWPRKLVTLAHETLTARLFEDLAEDSA